ncbi:OmpA family protein [Acidovorax kalamii]|uniref:OmpA family protein n=1 Tax=Acidovorax kalamii TaxID=2004485 RepID=UPI0020911160|nr:OmpA family protein [Acidovorax kalamii]MCO5357162.1 OmpA family protein [Acidovorax kalamii]
MLFHTRFAPVGLLTAAALLLAGCADTPTPPPEPEVAAAPAPVAPPPPAEPAPAPVPEEPRLPEDGMVAQFKATQVKLSPETQAILTRLAATREPTERLEITGYCHRKDAPVDAREIALMRAMAVRNELVKQGVPAQSIRVKFNTTQALHAVKITAK